MSSKIKELMQDAPANSLCLLNLDSEKIEIFDRASGAGVELCYDQENCFPSLILGTRAEGASNLAYQFKNSAEIDQLIERLENFKEVFTVIEANAKH